MDKFIPTELTAVASEDLQAEVNQELTLLDPENPQEALAKLLDAEND